MDQAAPVIRIAARRPGLVGQGLVFAAIGSFAAIAAVQADAALGFRLFLIATAVAFDIAAISFFWRALARPPALTIAPDGLSAPRHLVDVIPWPAIAHVTPIIGRKTGRLVLALRPDTAPLAPTWRRRLALKLRLAKADRLTLDLGRLDERPLQIVRLIEAGMRTADGDLEQARWENPELSAVEGRPLFAYALIALLVAIYAVEVALALQPTAGGTQIDIRALWALGGSFRASIVEHAQAWRLVTAGLLHAGLLHIVLNVIALVYAAKRLESRIGWRWFAATFCVSAITGSLMSTVVNPPTIVGVGASGGIMGLSAATAVVAFHFPSGAIRSRMLRGTFSILVPALLPVLFTMQIGGGPIDVAAHAGGALGGALVGLIIRALWPLDIDKPRGARAALGVAATYFLIAALSVVPITHTYRDVRAIAPDVPAKVADAKLRADELFAAYPRDPHVRYVHALALLDRNDSAGAEANLRAALADEGMLQASLIDLDPYLRGLLALVIVEKDRPGAERLVAGHCAAIKPIFQVDLSRRQLCPGGMS